MLFKLFFSRCWWAMELLFEWKTKQIYRKSSKERRHIQSLQNEYIKKEEKTKKYDRRQQKQPTATVFQQLR